MSLGLPYDSDQGRDFAGAVTAVMCGQAYLTSARIAEAVGPFAGYARNEEPFLEVIRMHRDAVNRIDRAQRAGGAVRGRRGVLGRGVRSWAAAPATATRR